MKDISNTFARLLTPSNILYDDVKKLEFFVIKMYNKTINAPLLWITQGGVFWERLPSRTTSTKANISCPEISYRRSIVPCRTCPRYGQHLYPNSLLNDPTQPMWDTVRSPLCRAYILRTMSFILNSSLLFKTDNTFFSNSFKLCTLILLSLFHSLVCLKDVTKFCISYSEFI